MLFRSTADIDLSFSAKNLNWLDDKEEDKNGSMIQRNTDFDAAQYDCDMRFYDAVNRLAIDEDDVVRMKIRSYIKPQHDLSDRGRMQFSLRGDLSTVRLYRYQKGRNGAPAGWVHFDSARQIELDEGEEMEFRVEGMRTAIDRLTVQWETVNQPRVGDYFDSVNYICWDVDLDIDSNNNSALKKPEQSDWEEYLEDHRYGIGKLLYPMRKDQAPPETDPNFGNRVGFVQIGRAHV